LGEVVHCKLTWTLRRSTATLIRFVELYLGNAERDQLDPILDACVAIYKESLDEDGQVEFKGKAKTFVRTYGFLSSVLLYSNASWEKLSIFLNFLIPKLPALKEEDLARPPRNHRHGQLSGREARRHANRPR
jgi:type I restriction enzyme R subunit